MKKTEFALTLHAARINAGLSRKQVVAKTGISYAQLGRYERFEAEPRVSDVQKLCRLYGVKFEDLRFAVDSSAGGRR